MRARDLGLAAAGFLAFTATARAEPMSFDRAAYVTCIDAQQMGEAERRQVGLFLAENAAKYYGISLHDSDQTGVQLGNLVQAGCTMFPNAYLFTMISSAVRAMATQAQPGG
jgi:hypothetical protein